MVHQVGILKLKQLTARHKLREALLQHTAGRKSEKRMLVQATLSELTFSEGHCCAQRIHSTASGTTSKQAVIDIHTPSWLCS